MSKSTEKSSHNQSCKGSDGASPCKTQPHITGDRQSQATATEIRSDRPEQRQAIDCSSFEVFSCWRYENEVEITCIQDRLLSTNLATWMQSSTTNRQGKQSISGLRIVIGRQLSGEIFPFTKQQMQALTRSPSLAERLHEVSSRAASLNVKLASEEADTALVFKFEKSVHEIRCLLTLRDCQSKITTVFIAALDPAEVTELWTTLHTKSKYYDHPLLLAIEICELQVEDLCAQLRRVQEQILAFDAFEEESRKSSGMYFKNIGDAAFERALDGIHSAKRDLERAEDCRASSSGLVAFLKEQCSERTGSDCYLQERLSTLSSTLDLLPAFKVLKWKLQSRHPFMTSQRDLAISQESRQLQGIQKSLLENAKSEDGSTDKLVALLTIVFVPSTFVAAIITMPIFDWSAPWDQVIVRGRLWVFFAIALPIQVLIMIATFLWLWSRDKERQKRNMKPLPQGPYF